MIVRRNPLEKKLNAMSSIHKGLKRMSSKAFVIYDEEKFLLEKFLESISKPPANRSFIELTHIMKYLEKTELMDKLKKENLSNISYMNLMHSCSLYIESQYVKKGEVLFKIDDIGDKFYIVLQGCIAILKPNEQLESMFIEEYIGYLIKLHKNKETYLLIKNIKLNYDYVPISDFEEIINIIFRRTLMKLLKDMKPNLTVIENLFEKYNKKFEDFNIDIDYVKQLNEKCLKKKKALTFFVKHFLQVTKNIIGEEQDPENGVPVEIP